MKGTAAILGIPFSKLTLHETILYLKEHIRRNPHRMLHLITANPEIAVASQTDKLLRRIIGEADLVTPDGIGIVLASRRLGDPIPERVTGYDLLLRLLEEGGNESWSFYFLGTDELTNRQAAETIGDRYPKVRIAGRHHGYFTEDEAPFIISQIQQARPDIVIVAMGAPYSDKWIYKYKQELAGTRLVFGVGGSLDVIAGKVKAAPILWKRLNLEWLHRLLSAFLRPKGKNPAGGGKRRYPSSSTGRLSEIRNFKKMKFYKNQVGLEPRTRNSKCILCCGRGE